MEPKTISLAAGRYFPSASGQKVVDPETYIQLVSSALSGDTTFTLEFSADGSTWMTGVNPADGEDLSYTLSTNWFRSFTFIKGMYWRINFAGATTGSITGTYND